MNDMSTKPENIDTSAERVHETDKSVHEDDDIQEYKRPWIGLTEDEIIAVNKEEGTCWEVPDKHAITISKAIEQRLKEKNGG
jgi:hypothetical protein